ncbi:MAG: hypothetical protein QOF61_3080 [Acidobacteriota bacterium]|jgi:hypothetical protein|nr:hypothetical protein [Acidobacteriota bacterium]
MNAEVKASCLHFRVHRSYFIVYVQTTGESSSKNCKSIARSRRGS